MQRPQPLAPIDQRLAAGTIAHQVIWRLHAALRASGRADAQTQRLFKEAVQIALTAMPDATRQARRLYVIWDEQELLDPRTAAKTLGVLSEEVDRVVIALDGLRARQGEIAAELRQLWEG